MNANNLSAIVIVASPLVTAGLSTIIDEIDGLIVDKYIENSNALLDYLKDDAVPTPSAMIIDAEELLKNDNATLLRLKGKWPAIKVIAVYMHKGNKYLSVMSKSNNVFFLSIYCAKQELIDVLTSAILVESSFCNASNRKEKEVQLTKKEKEFIGLICSNLTYKEIASIMGISKRTVDTHRDHLFDKFSINSRSALILQAIKIGMINDVI